MQKSRAQISSEYDRIKGSPLQKAIALVRAYSHTNGYFIPAKTSRLFDSKARVDSPFADKIAKNLDHQNFGTMIIVVDERSQVTDVLGFVYVVIGRDIYEGLIEGDELKLIVDVIMEKNNLTAKDVFEMKNKKKPLDLDNTLRPDERLVNESEAEKKEREQKEEKIKADKEWFKVEFEKEMAIQLPLLKQADEKLKALCREYKLNLEKINHPRSKDRMKFLAELERKLQASSPSNELAGKDQEYKDCRRRITNFAAALQNHAEQFKAFNDPQMNHFIKRALVILATVLASIPTFGVVLGCMAAYGHFAKKDASYFWKKTPTATEAFKKESEVVLSNMPEDSVQIALKVLVRSPFRNA